MAMSVAMMPGGEPSTYVRQVIDQQLQVMAQQLAILGGRAPIAATMVSASLAPPAPPPATVEMVAAAAAPVKAAAKAETDHEAAHTTYDVKKAFGAIARIHSQADPLTPLQRERLDALVARYTARTGKSKAYTAKHRGHMADPRVVNGFRPLTKEITYQIVICLLYTSPSPRDS